jgi:hypothetical protein
MAFVAFILLYLIFRLIHYLASQEYVIRSCTEGFTNGIISEKYDGSTSHTVNLPLTTRYSCQNFCGPTARCAITGQQCFADIDCPGCQPYSPPLKKTSTTIPGDNDAGKLTVGVTPRYSSLTSGYGTHERIITHDMYAQPPQPNFGIDTWGKTFNEGQKLFNQRYKSGQLEFMPKYPPMYTITGEFIGDGPLPANY